MRTRRSTSAKLALTLACASYPLYIASQAISRSRACAQMTPGADILLVLDASFLGVAELSEDIRTHHEHCLTASPQQREAVLNYVQPGQGLVACIVTYDTCTHRILSKRLTMVDFYN
jgi:hypothetical protein